MTGNDIVDLNIAKIFRGERRVRFIQKVFTSPELEIINSGEAGIWSLWAIKEAIYKAHHRRFDLPRYFDPKLIEVAVYKAGENSFMAEGKYNGFRYLGSGNLTAEYVHFTASCNPAEFIFLEIHPSSLNIKARLIQLVAERLKLDIKDIFLAKNDKLIPQLYYKNKDLKLPFSISQHGKFSAISFQLINY